MISEGEVQIIPAPYRKEESGNVGIEIKIDIETDESSTSSTFELTLDVYFDKSSIDPGNSDELKSYDSLEKMLNAKESEMKSKRNQTMVLSQTLSDSLERNSKIVDGVIVFAGVFIVLEAVGPLLLAFLLI